MLTCNKSLCACLQDFALANKTCLVCEYVPQSPLHLLQEAQSSSRSSDQAPQPSGELLALMSMQAWQHHHADPMFEAHVHPRGIAFVSACDD